MKLHPFLLTALLVLGLAGPARADLLFSNLGQPENGAAGFDTLTTLLATDFLTDSTPRTITSITAKLGNTSVLLTLTVSFSIYTDLGGTPDALLNAFDTPASIPAGGNGFFTATSAGINLQANTPYWVVGQINAPESIGGTLTWRFDTGDGTDGGPFSTVPGTPTLRSPNVGGLYVPVDTGNFIYSLEGTEIPEPSTLPVVVITGTFGAFGWWRRRTRVALDGMPDCRPTS